MRRLAFPALLVLLLLLVSGVLVYVATRPPPLTAPAPPTERWEYGYLAGDSREFYWADSRGSYFGTTDDVFQKLGGTVEPGAHATLAQITSLLGRQGWEMVSPTQTDKGKTWFRRRVN